MDSVPAIWFIEDERLQEDVPTGEEEATMGPFTKSDILKLSVAERIELAGDIWDSVAEIPGSVELTDAERSELDRRLAAYHSDPDHGSPWSIVRERIRSRK